MHREFLLNIVFLIFVNLLIKPLFIFGIDLQVQNTVAAEDYGLYFTLLSLACLFQIISDFGIQNFTNRHISRHPQLMSKYFSSLFFLKLLLSGVYLLFTPLVAWLVLGYGKREVGLLLILVFNQVLVQMVFFLRSNVSGLGHYRVDSFLSSLDKLLMLLTCGALLWGMRSEVNVFSFALAQTAALLLTCMLVFGWLRSRVSFPVWPAWIRSPKEGYPLMVSFLRQSVPYATAILLMTAYTRLDPILLERLLSDGRYHADVYAGAYRLLDASNMFGYLFASLLLPMFARQLRDNQGGIALQSLVFLSFRLLWAGSITLAVIISTCAPDLVQLLFPERATAYRWETLSVLIWTFVPVAVIYVFSTLLTANAQIGRLNRYFIIAIVCNILLNATLIPHWQAFGSAWAALLTQVFVAASSVWLCYRSFHWEHTGGLWVRAALYAGAVVGLALLLENYYSGVWYLRAFWTGAGSAVGCLYLFADYGEQFLARLKRRSAP